MAGAGERPLRNSSVAKPTQILTFMEIGTVRNKGPYTVEQRPDVTRIILWVYLLDKLRMGASRKLGGAQRAKIRSLSDGP